MTIHISMVRLAIGVNNNCKCRTADIIKMFGTACCDISLSWWCSWSYDVFINAISCLENVISSCLHKTRVAWEGKEKVDPDSLLYILFWAGTYCGKCQTRFPKVDSLWNLVHQSCNLTMSGLVIANQEVADCSSHLRYIKRIFCQQLCQSKYLYGIIGNV